MKDKCKFCRHTTDGVEDCVADGCCPEDAEVDDE